MCTGNCLLCGRCGAGPILDGFAAAGEAHEPRAGAGVAVDVGTTTVVLALLDLATGMILARHSFYNPQRAFGPDVLSRIQASNEGHLAEMRRLIAEAVGSGIHALLAAKDLRPEHVVDIVAAGNTTMTYLLLGYPCRSLGVSPFRPAYPPADTAPGVFEGVGVTPVPWFTAFVGGDIAAGLLSVLPHGKRRFLLLDLGTNGEMALVDNGRLTVTASAAGPAFEGGEGSQIPFTASEIVRELARLVRGGLVDETGRLSGGGALSQKHIRDLQLAKSAVRSGLDILSETVAFADIEAVYLAGGVGQAMDIQDAADIGLIPAALTDKAVSVGNASLGGAVRLLRSPAAAKAALDRLFAGVKEVNLAAHPRFNDLFIENMTFPAQ